MNSITISSSSVKPSDFQRIQSYSTLTDGVAGSYGEHSFEVKGSRKCCYLKNCSSRILFIVSGERGRCFNFYLQVLLSQKKNRVLLLLMGRGHVFSYSFHFICGETSKEHGCTVTLWSWNVLSVKKEG